MTTVSPAGERAADDAGAERHAVEDLLVAGDGLDAQAVAAREVDARLGQARRRRRWSTTTWLASATSPAAARALVERRRHRPTVIDASDAAA